MITSALPRPLRVCTAIGSMASMVIGLVWLLSPCFRADATPSHPNPGNVYP